MSTLLDSRQHHQCVHILSKKARETENLQQEPSNRRLPNFAMTNNDTNILTACQWGQRLHRQKEEWLMKLSCEESPSLSLSSVLPHASQVDDILEQSSTARRRQQGQRRCCNRESMNRVAICSRQLSQLRLVCTESNTFFSIY